MRIDRLQNLVADAQAVHDAGAVVLHQNVRRFRQPLQKRDAFGGLEVEGDGLLSRVLREEGDAHPAPVQLRICAQLPR